MDNVFLETQYNFDNVSQRGLIWQSVESLGSLVLIIPIYSNSCNDLKNKSGVDKIIVKKQPYQLLNTFREFFPNFYTSNFHRLVNESS